MKKHLFFLAASALALTACTSEDVVDDVATSTRNAIKFENVVNKMTRATDLNTGNFTKFHVFGFYTTPGNDKHANKVFDNVPVTYTNGEWNYPADAVRYWIPDAKYYFYAYSCGSISKLGPEFGTFSLNTDNVDGSGNELNLDAKDRVLDIDKYLCDYTHQHDLVVASNSGDEFGGIVGKESGNSTVSLQFSHILSRLKAKFTSSMSPEYSLVIKNVRITDVYKYGDYSFAQHWSKAMDENGVENTEKSTVYLLNTNGDGPEGMTPAQKAEITDGQLSVKNETVKDADNNDIPAFVTTNTGYVIPLTYNTKESAYLLLDVELMFGNDLLVKKTLKATINPSWQEGYSYLYNIDIKPEDLELGTISFTTSITQWGNNGNEETIAEEIDKKTN